MPRINFNPKSIGTALGMGALCATLTITPNEVTPHEPHGWLNYLFFLRKTCRRATILTPATVKAEAIPAKTFALVLIAELSL